MEMESNFTNTTSTTGESIGSYSLSSDPVIRAYYLIVVPIMICICFLAVLGNAYILASVPWIRKNGMTVNLILSLGLAGADAWAATLVLLGLVVNSYLPVVHKVVMDPSWAVCYFLVFELVRLAGMITSNMHLFALALNHWFSIVSPLRYKTAVTTGWCRTIMFLLWLLPLLVMLVAAVCVPGQGFRGGGSNWCNIDFYFRFPFRLVIFLQFIIPLVTMLAIYGYILRRLAMVRNTKTRPEGGGGGGTSSSYCQQRQALMLKVAQQNRGGGGSTTTAAEGTVLMVNGHGTTTTVENGGSPQSTAATRGGPKPEMRVNTRSNVLQSKIKALTTTLLILGTFALGWLPAVMQFTLVCLDCVISFQPPRYSLFAVGVVVNLMIILKLLINPVIYAFRILEIRYALWHMHVTRCGWRSVPLETSVPQEFRNLDSRRRTSQYTSTQSTRRKGGGGGTGRKHSSVRSTGGAQYEEIGGGNC